MKPSTYKNLAPAEATPVIKDQKIVGARKVITDYLKMVKNALSAGDPVALKKVLDVSVGEDAITLDDADRMLAMKDKLTINDFLPTSSKIESIPEGATLQGVLNEAGVDLLANFKFLAMNDINLLSLWDHIVIKCLVLF
jgi:hypothetical protein